MAAAEGAANIAGRQDLQKNRVPDPKRAPSLSTPEEVRQENQKAQNRWPIVTGFGAYISAMPNIVNGKQWATGLVDRVASAADLARICAAFARGDSLDGLDFVSVQDLYGQNVPTMIGHAVFLQVLPARDVADDVADGDRRVDVGGGPGVFECGEAFRCSR